MSRPDFISNEDIARWSNHIDEDDSIPDEIKNSVIIREVCYAGFWLGEELEKLHCPEDISVRIRYTGGQLSFGRDPWDVHMNILEQYKNNTLVFEDDTESPTYN
jgi:hypothetical protein